MHRDITDWLIAVCSGAAVVCLVMLLRPSRRCVSVALVLSVPIYATMGVLLAGFISAALASRLRIHYPLRMVVPRIGIYLGGIAGSLFALWAATSGPLAHGFKIKGPVAYAFLVAGIVAIVVFCWIGIPGYIHLSAPKAYPSSNPPSYALVVAG